MEREQPKPKPGERWRHYKLKNGVEYIANIVAIAQYSPINFTDREPAVIYGDLIGIIEELGSYSSFLVKDTETEVWLEVCKQDGQWTLFPNQAPISSLREPVGWARSLNNFMGVISFPYGDQSSNCYRFERL